MGVRPLCPLQWVSAMSPLLAQFAFLQLLDLLSTTAFLAHGVEEANPFVNWSMTLCSSPTGGLLIVKLMALGLGVAVWRLGRHRLLARVNAFFGVVVAWNVLALLLAATGPA